MYSRLESRLLNYFLLIAFAAVLIGIEFYFELSPANGQNICLPGQDGGMTSEDFNAIHNLRNKILIMFIVLSVVVAIVLMMFIKNITHPLSKMALAARRINEGDLSQTIDIETQDEIGVVGIAINELASNLQEVASFTSMTSNQALQNLRQIMNNPVQCREIEDKLKDIEANLESMSSFVNSFKLLNTDIKHV